MNRSYSRYILMLITSVVDLGHLGDPQLCVLRSSSISDVFLQVLQPSFPSADPQAGIRDREAETLLPLPRLKRALKKCRFS